MPILAHHRNSYSDRRIYTNNGPNVFRKRHSWMITEFLLGNKCFPHCLYGILQHSQTFYHEKRHNVHNLNPLVFYMLPIHLTQFLHNLKLGHVF